MLKEKETRALANFTNKFFGLDISEDLKPIALSEKELDRLEETIEQTQLYVYDGFMIRYHPQWDWIRSINVGQRKIIHSHFTSYT